MTTGDATPTGHQLMVDRRGALSAACLLAVTAAIAGCAARDGQGAPPGTLIGSTDDVPVGGGAVFDDHKVVVTQPVPGTFHAFSAVCTHQGCTVGEVVEGSIICPCHGSRFGVDDGAVVRGPADQPLSRADIAVDGTSITLV
jgi:Rieske Fe-S protein